MGKVEEKAGWCMMAVYDSGVWVKELEQRGSICVGGVVYGRGVE